MKKIFTFLGKIWTASIRRQLMLGIMLVHAVLMSIFVYDLVERQREFLHVQSVKQAKSLVKTLAVNSTSWVIANDVIGMEETIGSLVDYPSLRYAMILSPEGRVLGHTDSSKVGQYVTDSYSQQLIITEQQHVLIQNEAIDIASPILSNGVFIGWARINLSQKDIATGLEIIIRDGLIYTLLAIVIGALFAFYMAKGITRGLQQIVSVAEGVKGGNQSLRANISRHDEIGTLGEDFNIMLDTIHKNKTDFEAVMNNSPSLIYAKDKEGRYLFINQQWADLFDVEKKGIVGKKDHEIFDKAFADGFIVNDAQVFESGEAINLEEVAPHDDGVHTYTSIKFPLRDDNGAVYAVCGISTDITESLKIQEEKSALENQLQHTQKMQAIGQLTGGVAHDFNNLLAVILGYSELSKELYGKDNEQLNNYLSEIETAGIRGRDLIKQMMLYSRKDQTPDDLEPLQSEAIIEETASMLKATFPAGISINVSIEKNLPNVIANSNLLSQVLMNLCVNSKDGMGQEGALVISARVEEFKNKICHSCHELYSGQYIVINITDNGEGIEEEKLKRIFEPFFTTKQVGKGTGMGLSVVHGAVHKLHGHVLVESSVGKGTSFKVLLPESNKEANVVMAEEPEQVKYDFSGLNIMIVDDEPSVVALLEASLKTCKANLKVFNDSELALAYFEENPNKIDFVITDQTMPNLTGIVLSEKFLTLRPDIKIILCTGYSDEVTEKSATELGIKSFMNKPVKTANLYNIINQLR